MKQFITLIFKICVLLVLTIGGCKSESDFRITEWNSHSEKPIIFYLSGDAGFNTFSKV